MRSFTRFVMQIFLSSLVFYLALNGEALAQTTRPPNPEPLTTSEIIRPKQILKDGTPTELSERCKWYKEKLGRYINFINLTAQQEKIPPQLLMTVVLNEMADVGMEDVIQDQQLASTNGDFKEALDSVKRPALSWKPIKDQSFGIAQISPETAIKYNAIKVPGSERLPRDYVEFQVGYRLLNRPTAIHAAARVIKGLLRDIERNQNGAWVKQFIRPGQRFSAEDPYQALYPVQSKDRITMELQREKSLAYLVVAAYNTGNILTAQPGRVPKAYQLEDPKDFKNALLHAHNSLVIAGDIYESYACGLGLASWDSVKKESKPPVQAIPDKKPGSDEWIVWYADNIGFQPIYVTTKSQYEKEEPACRYPGGGLDCKVMLKKVFLLGPYSSRNEALNTICNKLKNFGRMRGVYAGMPVAEYNGKRHNLEPIGGCGR